MAKQSDSKNGTEDSIIEDVKAGNRAYTKLKTDQRVLARITDGIYREPASALRELIYNAFDADAKEVVITTDAPRFSQIVVSDDGEGMSIEVLNHILHHIGGSAKRTKDGPRLNITNAENSRYSPGGRRLIGKIGIGLFAVAQLTRHFQIITKPKNTAYRYVADIILKTYSEDDLADVDTQSKKQFDTGDVEVWREPAHDKEAHGTQVILLDLKPYARDVLQSRDRWALKEAHDEFIDEGYIWSPPVYHIGSVDSDKQSEVRDDANLPWVEGEDEACNKFKKYYQAVLDQVGETASVPELRKTVDNYLFMLWTLGLSIPIDYVETHPYELTGKDKVRVFKLSNKDKESAVEVKLVECSPNPDPFVMKDP